ncbi:immunity 8 family protein [Caballeronia ptereochthonis]|uniref:Immunity protein 8 n=1 Tax=Caballeronia ptereochthonis TaxID=1777144 RepID=A0A158EA29_9BURK|nr:immunity 8 family protein [Caballeronia ptereochthonis]SAL03725.1 hypothetical protein AWB83_06868 [Caballeronia ptereochthonis]
MYAVVKAISNDEFDPKTFAPENPSCFYLTLRIRIGLSETSGADDFEVCVCTPQWLEQTTFEPRWGRHLLIVREFSWSSIEQRIRDYVAECDGNDWQAIANKLSKVFAWEFEDYQP